MTEFLIRVEDLRLSTWIREGGSLLAFPTLLFLHTLGMSIVAGASTLLSVALLGFWPRTSLKSLEKLYRPIWVAFWINAVTGTFLLMADASKTLGKPDFYVKMTCVFVGVALLRVTRKKVFGDPALEAAPVSTSAKALAWASLVCWFGAIVAGRLLAYT